MLPMPTRSEPCRQHSGTRYAGRRDAECGSHAGRRDKHMKTLQCACCGDNCLGKQWWNRDHGFGVCPRCAYNEDQEEVGKMYGKPGIHYAAILNAECVQGMLVGWKTLNGDWHVGTLKEWDNGTAIIREHVKWMTGYPDKDVAVRVA